MVRTIARRIAEGAGLAARPRSNVADTAQSVPMTPLDRVGVKPPTNDRHEPTHTTPGLWTNDIGDDSGGELAATYAPTGGAMDGEIIYARPRDHVDLGDVR